MPLLKSKISILFKDTVVYGISNVVSRFIGFLLIPIFTRLFSPAEYGIIGLVKVFSSIVSVVLIMGIPSAVIRYYYDSADNLYRKRIASVGFFFEVIFPTIICASLLLLSKYLTILILKDDRYQPIVIIAICTIPFFVIRDFFLNLLRCKREKYKFVALTVGQLLTQTGLSIYLVVFLKQGIRGIFIAELAASAFLFAVGLGMTRENYSFDFSFPLLKELIMFGLPYVAIMVSVQIMSQSDKYFLLYFTSSAEVGLYTLGQQMASLMVLVVSGFQFAWAPFAYSIHKEEDAKRTYSNIFKYYVIVTTFIAIILTLFSEEILLLLSNRSYLGGAKVTGILAFNAMLGGLYYIFGIGVGIVKKPVYSSIAVGLGMIASLLLNFALVPTFGIQGAAVATLLANLVSVISIYAFSQRKYSVDYKLKKVSWALLAVFPVIGLNYIMPHYTFAFDVTVKFVLLLVFLLIIFLLPVLESRERDFIGRNFLKAMQTIRK